MFERIVLSVDGSMDSDKAVRATADLAHLHGSRVLVVHGRDVPFVNPNVRPSIVGATERLETDEEAQRLVDDAVAVLRDAGVEARGRVLPGLGRIGDKILDAAEGEDANLIVLGSRGMSRLHEVMIGSVSNRIVHMAKVPVLLVR
jgi:nucleotide-binding universal stress UspA family protein